MALPLGKGQGKKKYTWFRRRCNVKWGVGKCVDFQRGGVIMGRVCYTGASQSNFPNTAVSRCLSTCPPTPCPPCQSTPGQSGRGHTGRTAVLHTVLIIVLHTVFHSVLHVVVIIKPMLSLFSAPGTPPALMSQRWALHCINCFALI